SIISARLPFLLDLNIPGCGGRAPALFAAAVRRQPLRPAEGRKAWLDNVPRLAALGAIRPRRSKSRRLCAIGPPQSIFRQYERKLRRLAARRRAALNLSKRQVNPSFSV